MRGVSWVLCLAVLGLILFATGMSDTVHADRLEMIDGSVLWGRFLGSTAKANRRDSQAHGETERVDAAFAGGDISPFLTTLT